MKNVLILILFLATVVTSFFLARGKLRLSLEGLEGRKEKLVRGDLTLPINATGEIKPARRVEIKAEASGEVIEIVHYGGDRVAAGDLLLRLQQDEEERSVNRARLELDVTRAQLVVAQTNLEQARSADITTREARIAQMRESLRLARFRLDKIREMPEHATNPEEVIQRETTYVSQQAELTAAEADLERARLAITLAEQEVVKSQSAFETAKTNLADAEKRLAKTEIVSPIDGIVGNIFVQIGEVIQGGKTTLTGGTLLAVVLEVDKLIVEAEVDESDIGRVLDLAPEWARPGSGRLTDRPATPEEAAARMQHLPVITVESFRDEEFIGVIDRIYPEPVKIQNVVTYPVDVVIVSENKQRLLPGMRADVSFTSEHVTNVVLCPNEAIREGPRNKLGVYVSKPGAPPESRETEFIPCEFGLDNGLYSEVRCEALKEGMLVYTRLPAKHDEES